MNVTKSCHKHGCEWHSRCVLYRAPKAQIQIIPLHSAEHCDFFRPKEKNDDDRLLPAA